MGTQGASSGVYCGPLRLLAMEVYDNCNADGTYCNLITGGREGPLALAQPWFVRPSRHADRGTAGVAAVRWRGCSVDGLPSCLAGSRLRYDAAPICVLGRNKEF